MRQDLYCLFSNLWSLTTILLGLLWTKFVVLRFTKLLSAFSMVQLMLMTLKKKVKMLIQNSAPASWIWKQIKRDTKQKLINLYRHEVWSIFFHFQSFSHFQEKRLCQFHVCLPSQLWSTLTGKKLLPFEQIPSFNPTALWTVAKRLRLDSNMEWLYHPGRHTESHRNCSPLSKWCKTLIRTHTPNNSFSLTYKDWSNSNVAAATKLCSTKFDIRLP